MSRPRAFHPARRGLLPSPWPLRSALLPLALAVGLLGACELYIGSEGGSRLDDAADPRADAPGADEPGASDSPPDWRLLFYMNGDNSLEEQLLADLTVLEAVDLAEASTALLVLADRAEGYATHQGDWTGTRLYARGDHAALGSGAADDDGGGNGGGFRRLASPLLGLDDQGTADELNLASAATLRDFLAAAADAAPAEHTVLVLWGQDAGVGGGIGPDLGSAGGTEPDAADTLHTGELRRALEGHVADLLLLDLSSGALLERAYELAPFGRYLLASQGAAGAEGWDYRALLEELRDGAPGPRGFAELAFDSYRSARQGSDRASLTLIDLEEADALRGALDGLARSLEEWISREDSAARRELLRRGIFEEVAGFYETPGDLDVDLGDLARYAAGSAAGEHDGVVAAAADLAAAVDRAVLRHWQGGAYPDAQGLGVHFVELDALGYPRGHHERYFRDASVADQAAFVRDSRWVPDAGAGSGLLYELWYEALP